MIPETDGYGVYINGLLVVRLFRSDGRPRSKGNGFAMWSYNKQPLGWIDDGRFLIECVTAGLLVGGRLTSKWEQVPTGMRLIHPRYTLAVEQTSNGWLPTISDELVRRSHSLKPRATKIEAINILNDLLRRRVGREKPSFELRRWFGKYHEAGQTHQFQLALDLLGPEIVTLIQNNDIEPSHWRVASASKLANLLDTNFYGRLDPLPLLATTLAAYIKFALINVYRGADSVVVDPAGSVVTFAANELAAFRNRFRRSPMTDEEYLNFVHEHFVFPLRILRRKHRSPKSSIAALKQLRPRRDSGDFLIIWPCPPGTRFQVLQGPIR
jgi:hypothetical protein